MINKIRPTKKKILRNTVISFIVSIFISLYIIPVFEEVELDIFIIALIFLGIILILTLILFFVNVSIYKSEFIYFEDNKINYEFTFVIKKRVSLPLEKINVVKVKRNLLDLILNTSTVEIGSGSMVKNAIAEIKFCLNKEEAIKFSDKVQNLSKVLKENPNATLDYENDEVALDKSNFIKMDNADKWRFILSSSLTYVFIIFILLVCSLISCYPLSKITEELTYPQFIVIGLIIFVILIVFVIPFIILGVFVTYYDYKIIKYDDKLEISYGLLYKRQIYAPYDKIHGITKSSGLFGQIFKLGSLKINLIGINDQTSQIQQTNQSLYPFCSLEKLEAISNYLFNDFKIKYLSSKPSKKSFKHTVIFPNLFILFILSPFIVVLGYLSLYLLVIPFTLFTLLITNSLLVNKYARLGIEKDYTYLSTGGFIKQETTLKTASIQDIRSYAGFIRQRNDVSTYVVCYRGSSFITARLRVRNIKNTALNDFE